MATNALIVLKKLKILFTYFKKLCNKILKVANDVFHKRIKSQLQMFYFLSYAKMTKSDFFWRIESLYSYPHICCFCAAQNTHYFQFKIYNVCGIQY
jgi:hypothetical protein